MNNLAKTTIKNDDFKTLKKEEEIARFKKKSFKQIKRKIIFFEINLSSIIIIMKQYNLCVVFMSVSGLSAKLD